VSPSSDEGHDLHLVTVAKNPRGVATAGDDGAIDLDRHPLNRNLERLEHTGNRGAFLELTRFAIDLDGDLDVTSSWSIVLG
jgi:hypothetical protein